MTKRESIEKFGGGHLRSVLNAIDNPLSITALLEAYGNADDRNQRRYELVFPGIDAIARTIYNDWPHSRGAGLQCAFPGMYGLDDEVADPTAFTSGGYRDAGETPE